MGVSPVTLKSWIQGIRLVNEYSKRTSKYMYASIFHLFIYINKSIKLAVKFYNMLLRIVTTYQAIDKIEKASI